MKKRLVVSVLVGLGMLSLSAQNLQRGSYGYLYCHMSDNGEFTAYALSRDGLHYHDLNEGKAVMDAGQLAGIEGGQRDAYVCRKSDSGKGYLMVTTDMCVAKSKQWYNYGINLLKSDDLIHWTSTTFDFRKGNEIFCDPESPDIIADWSKINRVWAPQIFWDPNYVWANGEKGGYFIYYSIWSFNEDDKYDRMVYSYADKSFTKLTKPRVLFDWGYATIDADINYLESDHQYHMLIKKEGGHPGSSAFQIIGEKGWRVAYIQYSDRPKHYRICQTDEYLKGFHDPVDIQGVTAPQHGSFMRLTKKEYKRLEKHF